MGKNKAATTVCIVCGSSDVEYKAWVNCKTGELESAILDDDDTWCNDCQEHTGLEFK